MSDFLVSFCPEQWLSDARIRGLTHVQRSVYVDLAAAISATGDNKYPANDRAISRLIGISKRLWRSVKAALMSPDFGLLKIENGLLKVAIIDTRPGKSDGILTHNRSIPMKKQHVVDNKAKRKNFSAEIEEKVNEINGHDFEAAHWLAGNENGDIFNIGQVADSKDKVQIFSVENKKKPNEINGHVFEANEGFSATENPIKSDIVDYKGKIQNFGAEKTENSSEINNKTFCENIGIYYNTDLIEETCDFGAENEKKANKINGSDFGCLGPFQIAADFDEITPYNHAGARTPANRYIYLKNIYYLSTTTFTSLHSVKLVVNQPTVGKIKEKKISKKKEKAKTPTQGERINLLISDLRKEYPISDHKPIVTPLRRNLAKLLKEGFTADELLGCAKAYAQDIDGRVSRGEDPARLRQYVKRMNNFFGQSRDFEAYLPASKRSEPSDTGDQPSGQTSDFFDSLKIQDSAAGVSRTGRLNPFAKFRPEPEPFPIPKANGGQGGCAE